MPVPRNPLSADTFIFDFFSLPGFFVFIITAPPVVFRPKRIPCGPLKTSIDSRSNKSITIPALIPKYMPSTKIPTVGSIDGIDEFIPNPRIEKFATPLVVPTSSRATFGDV